MNLDLYKQGQKIRNFRLRAKMSQLDLENQIDAASGSVSRIENGVVNPTKETLLKIIEILQIPNKDAAGILGVDVYSELVDLINLSTDLNNFNVEEVMRTTAVLLVQKLGLMDLALLVVKERDKLVGLSMAETSQVKFIRRILPMPFEKIEIPLNSEKTKDNYFVKSLKSRSVILTHNLEDLGKGVVSKTVVNAIRKVSGFKSGLVIPMFNGDKPLGILAFTKNYEDDFSQDKEVLMAFARNITKIITNAENYAKLQEMIKKLQIQNER